MPQFDEMVAYHVSIPMQRPFRTSAGEIREKEFALFEARAGDCVACGEAAVDGVPFYTSETAGTALHIAERVLVPVLLGLEWDEPGDVERAMARYRGHAFTKAAFEAMAWDVHGQMLGEPVWRLLGGTQPVVEAGCSIGIKNEPAELVDAVAAQLADGMRRIKIKVEPGRDTAHIAAVREAYPDISLMVDANNAYGPGDFDLLKSWDAFGLLMMEQPLDQHDLYYHARLREHVATPVCLDESIETVHLADCAVKMGAADIVNIKVGRMGGLGPTRRTHDVCESGGVPVWIGSRPGTGVASAMRMAANALANVKYATDATFGLRSLDSDILDVPFDDLFQRHDGCMYRLPETPGLAARVDRNVLARYTRASVRYRA